MSKIKHVIRYLFALPVKLLALFIRLLRKGKWGLLTGLVILTAFVLVGLHLHGSLEKIKQTALGKMHILLSQSGLALENVTIEGRYHTARSHLESALNIYRGQSIFGFDLVQMQSRLEALPWVKAAMVRRILPDHLHVQLIERKALARYEENGRIYLIDAEGMKIIAPIPPAYANLPVFKGGKSNIYARDLLALLADYPAVEKLFAGAERFSDRRWTLHLNHGSQIHLPAEEPRKALDLLIEMQAEKQVLTLKGHAIDLRLGNRVMIRPLVSPTPDPQTLRHIGGELGA